MKERPILFNGEMVRAILDGRKTQTRRIVNLPKCASGTIELDGNKALAVCRNTGCLAEIPCPYGQPGDRLWVRETWKLVADPREGLRYLVAKADNRSWAADPPYGGATVTQYCHEQDAKWKPSIHMPRWASRITLEITAVRVERVQDIGKDGRKAHDVLAEGITREQIEHQQKFFHADDCPAIAYGMLFESINGPGSWDSNPWVWVIEFKRIGGEA